MPRRPFLLPAVLASALLVSACGGGGGTTSTSTSTSAGSSTSASAAAASSSPSESAEPTAAPAGAIDDTYWPIAVGNEWTYRGEYGGAIGTIDHKVTVTKVKPVADGSKVTMLNTFHFRNGSAPDSKAVLIWQFHADGSITVPYNTTQVGGQTSLKVTSGSMVWPSPAEFAAGTSRSGKLDIVLETVGQTIPGHVEVTIKPAGEHPVTVPAGSWTARELDSHLVSTVTVAGTTQSAPVDTQAFLVKGVGLVKTVFDFKGISGDEVLVSTNVAG